MNGIVILGCGASFRSGSPHIFSATLLHSTLIISHTCGSCPLTLQREDRHQETEGRPLFFLTTGSMLRRREGIAAAPPSLKLILPIRPVKRAHPEKNTTSIYQHPEGAENALIVLTLLKACHIFLIIYTRIHVRAAPVGMAMQRKCVRCIFLGKPRLALTNLSN